MIAQIQRDTKTKRISWPRKWTLTGHSSFNMPYIHSPALPAPFTYIQELMKRSQQRPSWLSNWQSVALDSRARDFDSHEGLGVAFFATGLG